MPEWDDCDDADPEIGAPEGETCDGPEIIINPAPDGDGDGVPEWDDCDDADPEIGAAPEGEECPEHHHHPRARKTRIASSIQRQMVMETAYEWDDCDDTDPAIGAAPEGEECPEPPPPPTCEEDPNCIINPAPDGDGDGVPEWDDCDDADPAIGAAPEGEECPEPPPPPLECEEDPDCEIIVNPAPDGDGDGVPEWDDCDDTDPEIGAAPEGEACPEPPPPPVD